MMFADLVGDRRRGPSGGDRARVPAAGRQPHPLNQLVPERWLRWLIVQQPELVGAATLTPVESVLARRNLNERSVASAAGVGADGEPLVVTCSTGVDLELVPAAADDRLAHAPRRVSCSPCRRVTRCRSPPPWPARWPTRRRSSPSTTTGSQRRRMTLGRGGALMLERLDALEQEFADVEALLADPRGLRRQRPLHRPGPPLQGARGDRVAGARAAAAHDRPRHGQGHDRRARRRRPRGHPRRGRPTPRRRSSGSPPSCRCCSCSRSTRTRDAT